MLIVIFIMIYMLGALWLATQALSEGVPERAALWFVLGFVLLWPITAWLWLYMVWHDARRHINERR